MLFTSPNINVHVGRFALVNHCNWKEIICKCQAHLSTNLLAKLVFTGKIFVMLSKLHFLHPAQLTSRLHIVEDGP